MARRLVPLSISSSLTGRIAGECAMRSLLLLSVAIAMLAVAAPHLITRFAVSPDTAASVVEDRNSGAGKAAQSRLAGSRQVEIAAERDGHFYVDAAINFRPVRLMVDTGASVVALRQSDAVAGGIRPRAADFDQPVATANGTAYAAVADLDSVTVRDIELRGVRALILPDEQLSISLLGGSFLNRLARFEVERGTLIFED
jgi:aspartyl protease family protein